MVAIDPEETGGPEVLKTGYSPYTEAGRWRVSHPGRSYARTIQERKSDGFGKDFPK
jgi:hypothetical protein